MTAQVVNERTTAYLTVRLLDKAGSPAVPTAVQYRVDCLTTGQAVRAPAAAPNTATFELTLSADDNAMRVAQNAREIRRVTVVATYGTTADQITAQYDYAVLNLAFVS